MAQSKPTFPSFKEWKNENLETLIDAFSKKFGNKIDEMADFFDHQYDQAKAKHVQSHEPACPSP